jgi:hypothetical protein
MRDELLTAYYHGLSLDTKNEGKQTNNGQWALHNSFRYVSLSYVRWDGWIGGGRLDCCYLGVILIWFVCLPSLLVYRNIEERSATGFIFLCVIVCDRQLIEIKITISRVYICTEGSICEVLVFKDQYIYPDQ